MAFYVEEVADAMGRGIASLPILPVIWSKSLNFDCGWEAAVLEAVVAPSRHLAVI